MLSLDTMAILLILLAVLRMGLFTGQKVSPESSGVTYKQHTFTSAHFLEELRVHGAMQELSVSMSEMEYLAIV